MSSRLEQFIRDHRDEFDTDEPANKVWEQVQPQEQPVEMENKPVIWLSAGRWGIAAAVSLLIAGSVWWITGTRPHAATVPHATTVPIAAAGPVAIAPAPSSPTAGTTKKDLASSTAATGADYSPEADYRQEMVYYVQLVELKHKELRSIEKDEPLLYKQFSGDVRKLDSVYHVLENQLPQNSNREQLLEAMLQDLQLQMRLLNHQLHIIKQINHSKKTAYEKAYKTT
jgi:hypothetical protein